MIKWYFHTTIHKLWVIWYMFLFCVKLMGKAFIHDLSKFGKEAKEFSTKLNRLSRITYGEDDYKKILKELEPTLKHHYSLNRHHPEHWENGISDMDLSDIIEMMMDWRSSIKKHKDGSILASLEVNRKRFNISDQLYHILKNSC